MLIKFRSQTSAEVAQIGDLIDFDVTQLLGALQPRRARAPISFSLPKDDADPR